MSSTQCRESMNNLMKIYMDASTSMSRFLNAFESALDSKRQNIEFIKYKETMLNIIYKTINPFEKQAASILTIYALKKFQEQLLKSSCYKILILQGTELNLKVFHVTRFETSSGRIVEYNLLDEVFTCTCRYMTFAGIICRHILRVATQLNLDSFSKKWNIKAKGGVRSNKSKKSSMESSAQKTKSKKKRVVNEEISNKENNPSNTIMYTTNRENTNKENDLNVTRTTDQISGEKVKRCRTI
ncbi:unnamed protein product [Rhizophagus irregularis]|nr:unnamed protein product [Rhizophagus irregularis]